MRRITCFLTLSFALCSTLFAAEPVTQQIGLARQDITPGYPIRLRGYAARKTESEGVAQRLWAKALALGDTADDLVVLITVDTLGIPDSLTTEVAERLNKRFGLRSSRLAICASHTHAGPAVNGIAQLILHPISPEQRQHIDQYTQELTAAIEQVAVAALEARRPGQLRWGVGKVDFAMNRRVLKDGKWTGFGDVPDGPVDHSLPMLCITDEAGALRGVLVNYACHCTTLGANFNQVAGDWAGYAQEIVERAHPGTVAMVSIGCGADANPAPRGDLTQAQRHGETVAREVERLLHSDLKPLGVITASQQESIELPLDRLPTREEFEQRLTGKGGIVHHAELNLERLRRGETLPTTVPYRVLTWHFGKDLAMVFLPGEVVVDYALRLQREYKGPLWITAYANDAPCYIASKRVLAEGGYEVDSSMYYYDRPTHFAPEVEDLIIGTVKRLLPGAPVVKGPARWASAIAAYEAKDKIHPPHKGGIVFVGSSSIVKWKLDESFPNLPCINRGFGGSQLADSVYYADRIVIPYQPRMVVLYAGDNDLGAGKSPEQVARDFEQFVVKVRATLPETKIIYLTVKPSPRRWAIVEKGRETNRRIAEFIAKSADQRLAIVDVASPMLGSDGTPKPEIFLKDQLHMNPAGYVIWADVLRSHLVD